jgi:hypothetical protein
MAGGNLALDLPLRQPHGRLAVLTNGGYDNPPIDSATASKKNLQM